MGVKYSFRCFHRHSFASKLAISNITSSVEPHWLWYCLWTRCTRVWNFDIERRLMEEQKTHRLWCIHKQKIHEKKLRPQSPWRMFQWKLLYHKTTWQQRYRPSKIWFCLGEQEWVYWKVRESEKHSGKPTIRYKYVTPKSALHNLG